MIEKFEPTKHYEQISEWWKAQNWPIIPLDMLPKTGFIVPGLASGFLYSTDSKFAIMEWALVNPLADKTQRREALDSVIGALMEAAKEKGHNVIFTSVAHGGLRSRYQRHGFAETDHGMTNLIRRFE